MSLRREFLEAWRRSDADERSQMAVDVASVGRADLLAVIGYLKYPLTIRDGMLLWVAASGLHVEAVDYLLNAADFDQYALKRACLSAGQAWLKGMHDNPRECARCGRSIIKMLIEKSRRELHKRTYIDAVETASADLLREASFHGALDMVNFFLEETELGLRHAFAAVLMAEKARRVAVIDRFIDAGFDPSPFHELVMSKALFDTRRLTIASEASKEDAMIKPVISRKTC